MRINVNPNTDAAGFGYAAPGQYTMRVVKCEVKEGTKAPYLKWEFEFVDPNVQTTTGKGKPGHVFENTTLSQEGNAQFQLRRLCDALGLPWEDFDTEDVVGMEFDAVLGTKEYEGTISNEVKKFVSRSSES